MTINTKSTLLRSDNMAGAIMHVMEQTIAIATKDTALDEFKAGVVRSMVQYNAGLVKTFDNVDDFLADLNSPE